MLCKHSLAMQDQSLSVLGSFATANLLPKQQQQDQANISSTVVRGLGQHACAQALLQTTWPRDSCMFDGARATGCRLLCSAALQWRSVHVVTDAWLKESVKLGYPAAESQFKVEPIPVP